MLMWSHAVVAGVPCRTGHGACKAASRAPALHRRLRQGGVAARASRDDAASSPADGDDDDVPSVPREGSLAAAARFERLFEDERTPEESESEALRLAALKAEIQWSIEEAEATCKSDSTTDCAIAWEQVLELREAEARSAPPPLSPSSLRASLDGKSAAPGTQARGLGDPLGGLTPSQVIGTVRDAPATGSLQAAGKLERMMRGGSGSDAAPGADAAGKEVAAAPSIPAAIQQAVETCAEEGGPACAAAWDEVEELSAHKSHEKRRDETAGR